MVARDRIVILFVPAILIGSADWHHFPLLARMGQEDAILDRITGGIVGSGWFDMISGLVASRKSSKLVLSSDYLFHCTTAFIGLNSIPLSFCRAGECLPGSGKSNVLSCVLSRKN